MFYVSLHKHWVWFFPSFELLFVHSPHWQTIVSELQMYFPTIRPVADSSWQSTVGAAAKTHSLASMRDT